MGILDLKEFTAGIMKFSVNMEHPSGMVIKALVVSHFSNCVTRASTFYGTGLNDSYWVVVGV